MTQDILLLLLPYLSPGDDKALFQLSFSREVLLSQDNGVQKRGYKILARLIEKRKDLVEDVPALLERIDELLEGVSQAAKKV